jgi:Icc protein
MRIVQITDLHVGQEGEDTYGVDVRANFLKVLEAVEKKQPEYLVLSGDLCYRDGQSEIYQWIRSKVDALGIPYEILSGNHDDPVMMAEAFERKNLLKGKELYFTKTFEGRTVIFLDTTTGIVSLRQQEWLKEQLSQLDGEALVFMHHPPLTSGVPFMDEKHALQNKEELQEIFFSHPYNINIFTGHYHVEKVIRKKNIVVHITPSCFFQIGQESKEFRVDHYRIGLREINWNNGVLMNAVHYL